MTYSRLIFSACCIFLLATLFSCQAFERENELINFLKKERKLEVAQKEYLDVYVLQDNICGACTRSILDFMYGLNHEHSLVVLSDENKKLIKEIENKIGAQKVFTVPSLLIERYGLRYASDLMVSFQKGEVDFWSFVEDENFEKIASFVGSRGD